MPGQRGPVVGRSRRHKRRTKSLVDWISDAFNTAYDKIVLEGILRQKPLPPSKDGRHVPLHARFDAEDAQTLIDERSGRPYCSNWIRSSRYSLVSFVPKQLWFQFTKLANVYFLALGLLQVLSPFSTTGKWTTIGPLAAFIAFSMAKEAFDDFRRWQMDRSENRSLAWVLRTSRTEGRKAARGRKRGPRPARIRHIEQAQKERPQESWVQHKWEDINVGDIVRLVRDDSVPADLVLLHATGPEGVAYVETMALDGETNLKSKQALPLLAEHCNNLQDLRSYRAVIVSEDPNLDLYNFEGRACVGEEALPLTLNNVTLRGSVLRNTSEAIGLVVNTGEECKIRMNANRHVHAKAPAMQGLVNRLVLFLILVLLAIAFGLTGGYYLSDMAQRDAWYLTKVPFADMFFGYVIMFDTLIPLSLYVSLEIIKIFQLFFMSDVEMYDPKTNTPMVANTDTILENLGQVNYVFSDKTGTLTENIMRFRKMSVAGTAFFDDLAELHEPPPKATGTRDVPTTELLDHIRSHPDSELSQKARHFLLCITLCHTCLPETRDGRIQYQASSPDEQALVEAAVHLGYAVVDRPANSIVIAVTQPDGSSVTETFEVLDVIEFSSARKRMSIVVRLPDGQICIISKGADSAIVPRLRHSGLARDKSQSVQRQASQRRQQEQGRLARRMSSEANHQSIDAPARNSWWGSDRMSGEQSRRPHPSMDGSRIAEEPVEMDELMSATPPLEPLDERAVPDEATIFERTFQHTDRFASDGLRTLMYGYAFLDEERYREWRSEFQEATTSLSNRQERLEAIAEKIEVNLELAGATAIEDKLQDSVPETIDKLRRAGIKVWMLTGDKRETAVTIGYSAQVCKPASEVFVLDATTGDLREPLTAALEALETGSVPHSVLVVDGHTLGVIEDAESDDDAADVVSSSEPTITALFYDLVAAVDSVICCRASPSQKAALVTHVNERVPGSMTLAIGDGSNDIGMIQASHVGIGISGREGLQAARIADYSIAQFRFLLRLLLVHGRWNYSRTAKYILATFWKEISFYLVQAHFQRWTLYTGTSLYEGNTIAVFNVLFTSVPVIFMGIIHSDLKPETLLAFPELYASFGPKNAAFNLRLYLGWMFLGIVESLALFWMFWAMYQYALFDNDDSLYAQGLVTFTVGVIFINVKILLFEVHNKNWIIMFGFFASIIVWFGWNLVIARIYAAEWDRYVVYGSIYDAFGKQLFWWAAVGLVLATLVSIELVAQSVRRVVLPTDVDLFQQLEKEGRVRELQDDVERGSRPGTSRSLLGPTHEIHEISPMMRNTT